MTDFQAGRVGGVHSAGERVESLAESFDAETNRLDSVKVGIGMSVRALEAYREAMLRELAEAKIPIKEAEYGKTYINRCIDIIKNLYQESEVKRMHAIGAALGLKDAVSSIKKMYDEESVKLSVQREFESTTEKDPKQRPVGAEPNNPLAEYKKKQPRAVRGR